MVRTQNWRQDYNRGDEAALQRWEGEGGQLGPGSPDLQTKSPDIRDLPRSPRLEQPPRRRKATRRVALAAAS
jgi:hypothetical protein